MLSAVLTMLSITAQAHEVWLEKDNDNSPVRVYLGEPGEPDSGDKIDNLKGAQVFITTLEDSATLTQKEDHWQAAVTGEGDVRLVTDKVWQPWSISDAAWWQFWAEDKLQGAILQARAGRSETIAKLTFELVPVTANGNVFRALFKGQPLVNQNVTLLLPSKKELTLTSDSKGQVEVTTSQAGQYLLSSVNSIDIDVMHSGKKVASLMYITSLTFLVD